MAEKEALEWERWARQQEEFAELCLAPAGVDFHRRMAQRFYWYADLAKKDAKADD